MNWQKLPFVRRFYAGAGLPIPRSPVSAAMDMVDPGRVAARQVDQLIAIADELALQRDWLLSVVDEGRQLYKTERKGGPYR